MMTVFRTTALRLTVLLILLCSPPAAAHGGRWVGPAIPGGFGGPFIGPVGGPSAPHMPPVGGPTTAPGIGAPTRPPVPGGLTPTGAATADWESWWEFNWEWIIDARRVGEPAAGDGPTTSRGQRTPSRETVRERFLQSLLSESRDHSDEVRSAAMVALGKTMLSEAFDPLVGGLEDSVRDVREGAVIGLALIGQPQSLALLRDRLLNERVSKRERAFAAAALGLMGTRQASVILLELIDPARPGKRVPRQLHIAALMGLAASSDRTAAATIAAHLNGGRIKDNSVRAVACATLGRIGGRSVLPSLQAALGDSSKSVREAAALAMGGAAQPQDTAVIKSLIQLALEDSSPSVKSFAILSLGRIGGEEARRFLRYHLNPSRPKWNAPVLQYAFLALGFCGQKEDGQLLGHFFKKRRGVSDRSAAAIALGIMRHRPAAKALLGELATSRNRTLFNYVAVALGMMREPAVTGRLLNVVSKDRSPERVRAALVALSLVDEPTHVKRLAKRIRAERSSVIKGALAQAVASVADQRHGEALLDLLASRRKPTDALRALLIVALGRVVEPYPLPALSRLRRDAWFMVDDDVAQELMSLL